MTQTVTVERKDPKQEPTCKQSLQVEQEPVAVSELKRLADAVELRIESIADRIVIADKLRKLAYTTPPQPKEPEQEQEPYAWEFAGTIFHDRKEVFDWYERGDISDIPPLALYTKPKQRKETK